jgi:hypothetical protein
MYIKKENSLIVTSKTTEIIWMDKTMILTKEIHIKFIQCEPITKYKQNNSERIIQKNNHIAAVNLL